jgi:hypothetical protein
MFNLYNDHDRKQSEPVSSPFVPDILFDLRSPAAYNEDKSGRTVASPDPEGLCGRIQAL